MKSSIQKSLEMDFTRRVGMTLKTAQTRMNTGFFARP